MTEAMPFLQNYDITFLRPPPIPAGGCFLAFFPAAWYSKGIRTREEPFRHVRIRRLLSSAGPV